MNGRLQIDGRDNVCVLLAPQGDIPAGHKVALCDIQKGGFVYKYGEVIGRATQNIRAGEWVHTHNLRSHLDEDAAYSYTPRLVSLPPTHGTFMGYRRPIGRAGIRNDVYIIPTVGCVNNVCKALEHEAQRFVRGSIDGITALTHQFGCSQLGDDGDNIRKLICGIARNPNASFVLIVGLGCENNALAPVQAALQSHNYGQIAFYNCQEVSDEVACGTEILRAFSKKAAAYERESVDLSELALGVKCGGSDAFSGITANPAVGKVSDRLVSAGGSVVLTEVPEMFGAEQILMNKCIDEKVFEKYRDLIVGFKARYTKQGFPVYENPSPGNRAGGITTLEEKSLGCIRKAGQTPVTGVLGYGEQIQTRGVSVLDAPGNDLVAATALGASGCQAVLFTTGRGTPFSAFVPTVKISSNARLAQAKSGWIDFDASGCDDEGLWQYVTALASGEVRAKSERMREIAFYKTGVTL